MKLEDVKIGTIVLVNIGNYYIPPGFIGPVLAVRGTSVALLRNGIGQDGYAWSSHFDLELLTREEVGESTLELLLLL